MMWYGNLLRQAFALQSLAVPCASIAHEGLGNYILVVG
jgi:hypothetical protein